VHIPRTAVSVYLTVVIGVLQGGCMSRLPRSAEPLLLRRVRAEKLIAIHDFRHRTIAGFDYIGCIATFEVTWGFEGRPLPKNSGSAWYQPEIILRKKHSDSDWSKADLFSSNKLPTTLFELTENEFIKDIEPWAIEKP
jgi:hypothetical protein